jgi:general secretion pathway protein K
MQKRLESDSGFALVLVLWVALLLSIVAGSLISDVRTEGMRVATEITALQARLAADGAINLAILSLFDASDPNRWRIDGTPRDIRVAGQPVTIRVTSESGKIDLNAAPESLFASIFLTEGLSAVDSESLADRVVTWRSPLPSVAIDGDKAMYRDAGRTYTPRHAPFHSVGELRLVLGMTDSLQSALTPLITVYTNSPNVDISVAGDGVLRVMSAAGNRFAASQLAARSLGNAAGANRAASLGEPLTIEASAARGPLKADRLAIIRAQASRDEPYQVLSWR